MRSRRLEVELRFLATVAVMALFLIIAQPEMVAHGQIPRPSWPAGAELTATNLSPDGALLNWPVALTTDDYFIYQASDRCERDDRFAACEPVQRLSGRNVSTSVSLEPGTQYLFWINACNSTGCSDPREDPAVIFTTPFPIGMEISTPGSVIVVQDDHSTVPVEILVGPSNDPPGLTTLAIQGLPSVGTTFSFDPPNGIPPFASRLTIGASTNTPQGQHTLTLVAESDDVVETALLELEVQEPPNEPVTADDDGSTPSPTPEPAPTRDPGETDGTTETTDGFQFSDIASQVVAGVIIAAILGAIGWAWKKWRG